MNDNSIDHDMALQFHDCHSDKATLVHGRDGSVLECYRPRPTKCGASIKDMNKFINLHRIQEIELAQLTDARRESCEPWAALWLGCILGSSFVIVMVSLWALLR